MRKRAPIMIVITLAISMLMFAGCNKGMLKWDQMTPQDKVSFAMAAYVGAAQDYIADAGKTDLTEEEINYLRDKRKVLVELWDAIRLYKSYVDTGIIPAEGIEQKMVEYLGLLVNYPPIAEKFNKVKEKLQ